MPTQFYTPINNASSTLSSGHSIGETSISLATGTGPLFGSPSPSLPIRLTIQRVDSELLTIFQCTGRTGDVLTGLAVIEGSTDRSYSTGDTVEIRATAGTFSDLNGAVNTLETNLASHTANSSNPHGTTKAQVGLSNVDNTSDANKPLSVATSTALALKADANHTHTIADVSGLQTTLDAKATTIALSTHVSDATNPHSVTKAQVGLSNVDNTSDLAKPISTLTATALSGKAPTVHAHVIADVSGLQTTLDAKASASSLTTHVADTSNPHGVTKAQVGLSNVDNTSDANKSISTLTQAALDTKATTASLITHTSNTSNPHSVTKAQVGLGSVDNTADLAKPVSTATQTALDGKAALAHTHAAGDITSGTLSTARLGSGTANSTKVLYGDSTWKDAPTGGGGGGAPGGVSGDIQVNNDGVLDGLSNLTWDFTNNTLKIQADSGQVGPLVEITDSVGATSTSIDHRGFVGIGDEPETDAALVVNSVSTTNKAAVFRAGGSSTGSPDSIPGLALWLDATQISGKSDGDAMNLWADASGNSHNGTQTTTANQPMYKTGVVNGLPGVRFDSDKVFTFSNFTSGYTSAEMFVVIKIDNDPPIDNDGSWSHWGSHGFSAHLPYSDGNIYDGWGSANRYGPTSSTGQLSSWSIYNITSASSWTQRLNGVQIDNQAGNTVGWDSAPTLGGKMTGYITEYIVFNRSLTTGERADLYTYLDVKWRTAATLDLVQYQNTGGVPVSGVDRLGYMRSVVGNGPPSSSPANGSMYSDITNGDFYVMMGTWKKVTLA